MAQNTLPGLRSELEDGEPVFVLRANDPLAFWLVDIWVNASRGDAVGALLTFGGMIDRNHLRYSENPRSDEKLDSAEQVVKEMNNWRIKTRRM